ncbi:MAG: hypothetical protein ABI036_07515 [Fibrobacteria bacterium]
MTSLAIIFQLFIFGLFSFAFPNEINLGSGISNYGGLLKDPYSGKQVLHFTPYLAYQLDLGGLSYRIKSQYVYAGKFCLFCGEKLNVTYFRISQEVKYPFYEYLYLGAVVGYQYQISTYKFPTCASFTGCDDWSAQDHLAGFVKDYESIFLPQLLIQKRFKRFESTLFIGFPVELNGKREKDIYVDQGWDDSGNLPIPNYSEKQEYGVLVELDFGMRFRL